MKPELSTFLKIDQELQTKYNKITTDKTAEFIPATNYITKTNFLK